MFLKGGCVKVSPVSFHFHVAEICFCTVTLQNLMYIPKEKHPLNPGVLSMLINCQCIQVEKSFFLFFFYC